MWWQGTLLLAATAFADSINVNEEGLQSFISLARNGSAVDVHVQAYAPVAAGWGSIGIGSQMENALMFVMYPSSDSHAVTVSARTARGHVMPEVASGITIQVTNSSVDANSNGMMMAEFVCYGCTQWPTGQLSTTSTSQPFIYALGPGAQAGSDDRNATIMKHSANGMVTGDAANAFTDASTASTPTPAPVAAPKSPPRRSSHKQVLAHAILMCTVFFGLMPTAVILLRLPFMGRAAYHVHWMIQMTAWSAAIAALGIAINFSKRQQHFKNIDSYHQIIGVVLTSVIILQAPAGFLHHLIFKKQQRRTAISYGHMVLGWMIITLGMLNGCFGLWLAENINAAWGLGAAGLVIFLTMLAVSMWAGWRRRTAPNPERSRSFEVVQSPKGSDMDDKERIAYTSRVWK